MSRLTRRRQETRSTSLAEIMADLPFSFGGTPIWARPMMAMETTKITPPDGTFDSMVEQIHKGHDVISAAVVKRAALVSELRFKWRDLKEGQNGRLWGDQSLAPLEYPNPSQSRSSFLRTAEMHVSYGGTAFFHREKGSNVVRLLNPGYTSVVMGSDLMPDDPALASDAEVVGFLYQPRQQDPKRFIPADEVARWCPEPDPINWWRGLSWVQAVLSEFVIDRSAHTHVTKFFENAATPQMVFTFDVTATAQQIKDTADVINADHSGAMNAYRNLFIGGGADAKVVGADLQQLDLRKVIGLTETRISTRSMVPAIILGIAEGLGGSALNAGNYSETRRMFSDMWFTPAARDLCAALEQIVPPPPGSELSYDPAQIMFLQDDRNDEAEIASKKAITTRQYIDAGFIPESVVAAVDSGDTSKLVHSGLYSVQLQAPGATQPELPSPPARSDVYITNNIPATDVTVEGAQLHLDARQEPPTVNIGDTHINVEPSPVTVEAPINVERSDVHLTIPEPTPIKKVVRRDTEGNIAEIIEERG